MLKLSKKWSYALKAVLYIAKSREELVKIKDISEYEKISEALLRRIIAELERYNVLKTIKWRNWGVSLWRELKEISVYDILFSVWEELGIRDCTKWIDCVKSDTCSTTTLLWSLQKWFNGILKLHTLDKIVK